MASESQSRRSFTGSTTVPNTPEGLEPLPPPNDSDKPTGDFARLTPSSVTSRLAFHKLISSLETNENSWHRKFIYTQNTLQILEDDDENSTSGESFLTQPVPAKPAEYIRSGYWRLNMEIPPAATRIGWAVGRGRWAANGLDDHGMVDLLLTSNTEEKVIHGRHTRFFHHPDTYRLVVEASSKMKFNGETLSRKEVRELPWGPTIIGFGSFEYTFTWVELDQEIYRRQLDALAESYIQIQRPPPFITPTPSAAEYQVGNYRISGTFAIGSTAIVSPATDKSGQLFAAKKIIAKNHFERKEVEREVEKMKRLVRDGDAPPSLPRLVEVLTIDPTGPSGVYEYYLITTPLIAQTLAGILQVQAITDSSRLTLASQMLQALDFIHAQGCMHRDIKLDNILARISPLQAVIIDFGHSTWLEKSTDDMRGTVRYLAPEVLEIKELRRRNPGVKEEELPTYDRAADVWSMGLTIWELLSRWRFEKSVDRQKHAQLLDRERWIEEHMNSDDGRVLEIFGLLCQMLEWLPGRRISAKDAFQWVRDRGLFVEESDAEVLGSKRTVTAMLVEPVSSTAKRLRE